MPAIADGVFDARLRRAGGAAAARLRIRRRQRLPAARGTRAPRARRRGAGKLLHRSADVPGHQRRFPTARAIRCGWSTRTTASTSKPRSWSSPTTCRWRSRPSRPPAHIQLIGLVNDVSLRNLIPGELAKGFGFLQSKPRSALSPGVRHARRAGRRLARQQAAPAAAHAHQRRMVRRARSRRRHAVRLRPAGGACGARRGRCRPAPSSVPAPSPTRTRRKGASCFAEKRTVETLRDGKPSTPFMKFGDVVRIEMLDRDGSHIFGAIEQRIERQPLALTAAARAHTWASAARGPGPMRLQRARRSPSELHGSGHE